MQLTCPHCSRTQDVADDQPAFDLTCIHCGRSFDLISRGDDFPRSSGSDTPDDADSDSSLEGLETPVLGGRFRVQSFHAKGGLGRVLAAVDEELGRRVAIKEVLPRWAHDGGCRDRLVLEAEVTGGLEHPGIVPVYGRGSYADGRPFYAMRFIRGENLAAAIKRFHTAKEPMNYGPRAVELRDLLDRFIDVCHAVEYAHSRGVLHRDLKPGNVMLGKYGETLVVDWGLAKVRGRAEPAATGDESVLRIRTGSGSHPTRVGSKIGTIPYMSPEQAEGRLDAVTQASDVYSLGATLYHLLVGRAPFELRTDILDRVKAGDFPTPRSVRSDIPRPLEAICRKAMQRLPAERYATAGEMIDDIKHWMADEPVSVYRESLRERWARWARRHRAWVQAGIGSLAIICMVAIVAAVLVTQARQREQVAWNAAQERFEDAREAVDKWLTGSDDLLQYYPATQDVRKELLRQAAEDYEEFASEGSPDLDVEVERGRTLLRLGHLQTLLGDGKAAEDAYQQAQTLFASLLSRFPDDETCRMELANCHTNLAVLAVLWGNVAEADGLYVKAIDQLRPLLIDSSAPRVHLALATALLNHGELLTDSGRYRDGEVALVEGAELLKRRIEEPMSGSGTSTNAEQRLLSESRVLYVKTSIVQGAALQKQGRYDDAADALNNGWQESRELLRLHPNNPQYLKQQAECLVALSALHRLRGRLAEEEDAYREAITGYKSLNQVLPNVREFIEGQALTQMDYGGLSLKLGRVTDAETHLTTALDAFFSLAKELGQQPLYLENWAACGEMLGELWRDRGDWDRAESSFRQAIQGYEQLLAAGLDGDQPLIYAEGLALCHSHLGQLLHMRGKYQEADGHFGAAEQGLIALPGDTPMRRDMLAFVYFHRACLLDDMDQAAQAIECFRQAKALWRDLATVAEPAPEHQANYAWFLANCPQVELREPDTAVAVATNLIRDVPDNATYQTILAAAYIRATEPDKAVPLLEAAKNFRGSEHGRDYFLLGLAHEATGSKELAARAYEDGETWRQANLPEHAELKQLSNEAATALGVTDGDKQPE